MTNDQRLFDRIAVTLPVRFKGSKEYPDSRILLQDISAQGARLVSKERFFLNDYVALEAMLPATGETVDLHGQVVWISGAEPQKSWNVGLSLDGVRLLKLGSLCQAHSGVDNGQELV